MYLPGLSGMLPTATLDDSRLVARVMEEGRSSVQRIGNRAPTLSSGSNEGVMALSRVFLTLLSISNVRSSGL